MRAEVPRVLHAGWEKSCSISYRVYLGIGTWKYICPCSHRHHHYHHHPTSPDWGVILHSRDLPGWKMRSRLAFSPAPQTTRVGFTHSSALDQVIPNFGLKGFWWEAKVRFDRCAKWMGKYILKFRSNSSQTLSFRVMYEAFTGYWEANPFTVCPYCGPFFFVLKEKLNGNPQSLIIEI